LHLGAGGHHHHKKEDEDEKNDKEGSHLLFRVLIFLEHLAHNGRDANSRFRLHFRSFPKK
jgi:hypothetical protein